jgi:hypothetical protein
VQDSRKRGQGLLLCRCRLPPFLAPSLGCLLTNLICNFDKSDLRRRCCVCWQCWGTQGGSGYTGYSPGQRRSGHRSRFPSPSPSSAYPSPISLSSTYPAFPVALFQLVLLVSFTNQICAGAASAGRRGVLSGALVQQPPCAAAAEGPRCILSGAR